MHFLVFGTHPKLSLAEFQAVQKSSTEPILCGPTALVDDSDWNGAELMDKLGGTVKLGEIVKDIPIAEFSADTLAEIIQANPRADRIVFGLTVYGSTPAFKAKAEKSGIAIKRALTSKGYSVRWVTSEKGEPLSPAAVAKMRLTDEGYDFVLCVHDQIVSIGLTSNVQDADAWSLRDYGRPKHDDKNGMLPPKVARIMVNLANLPQSGVLLDPFCGSGTVLMEASLTTGASLLIASDIEEEQVEATRKNLDWMAQKELIMRNKIRQQFFTSDVRNLAKTLNESSVDAVVTEGYLGPLLTGHETAETLENNARTIENLWVDTLKVLRPILKNSGRVVGVWPSFKSSHGVARVDISSELEKLGYRNASPDLLLYHREGQRVMRRIVILEKV